MKKEASWRPTRYIWHSRTSRFIVNKDGVGYGSWFVAGLQIEAYQDIIASNARGRLMDCGCGKVPLYEVYKGQVDEVVCVDWGNTYNPSPHLDVETDLNKDLPFEDNSFDTILLSDVIAHISEPSHLMSELNRVLNKGGKVLVMSPFFYWINEAPFDFQRFTEFGLKQLCDKHGLAVERLESYGGFPDIILDLLSKRLPLWWGWQRKSFYRFCQGLSSMGFYKKYRKKQQDQFPLGYVLIAKKK